MCIVTDVLSKMRMTAKRLLLLLVALSSDTLCTHSDEGLLLEMSTDIHTFGSSPPFSFRLSRKIGTQCVHMSADGEYNYNDVYTRPIK